MTSFGPVVIEEAIGSACDIQDLDGYLHLLAFDLHSPQRSDGYRTAPLTVSNPCSFERWFRIRFEPPFTYVYGLKFWVANLALPAGWQLQWGVASDYSTPVGSVSSIATQDLPTSEPVLANFAVKPVLDLGGIARSPWVVLQARLVGAVAPGPAMVDYGPEVDTPVLIEYHLDWSEG